MPAKYSRQLSAPDTSEPSRGHIDTEQDGNPRLVAQQGEELEKHPLVIWVGLKPGDVVSIQAKRGNYVGTVECSTQDGLIIWIRDNLNERKLFHFRDCQSVCLWGSVCEPEALRTKLLRNDHRDKNAAAGESVHSSKSVQ